MSGAGAITTNAYHIFAPSHITMIGKGRLRAMHCVSRSRRMEDDDIMAFGHSYQDESLMGSTLAAPHEARRSHALGHLHLCFESRGRLIAA